MGLPLRMQYVCRCSPNEWISKLDGLENGIEPFMELDHLLTIEQRDDQDVLYYMSNSNIESVILS